MDKPENPLQQNKFKAFVKTAGADDFIFLLDFKEDVLLISEEAVKVFDLPTCRFSNAVSTVGETIHPEEKELFEKGIERLKQGDMLDYLSEIRVKNKHGGYDPIILRGKLLEKTPEDRVVVGIVQLKSNQKDEVTGLPLESQMRSDYNEIRRINGCVSGYLLAIRIEGLEHINANFGLETGDHIFNMVAKSCTSVSDKDTNVYRISGNKIAVLNMNGRTALEAQDFFAELKRRIADIEFNLDYSVVFTISAGVVAFMNDRSELKDLIKKAGFCLAMGKKSGKNNLYLFNSVEYSKHINKLSLREKLREAVKHDFRGFEMFYQPVVDAKSLALTKDTSSKIHVIGAEALLRWSDPALGMVGADKVIPILEESGLMAPVGRWLLMKAFSQCHAWNKYDKNFRMSVNLSYVQFERSDILFDVQCALEKSKVNPENITLEITESGYIDHDELQKLLDEFHKMKIQIDIDDFGTGYSNLRYIQNLHANTLKLDYSFVHKAVIGKEGENERKVIQYIINMAHDLGMNVCLEGIESLNDVKILEGLKPDKYQGYLFGKPVSSYAFFDNNRKYLEQESTEATPPQQP